jgi:hypothetical protein
MKGTMKKIAGFVLSFIFMIGGTMFDVKAVSHGCLGGSNYTNIECLYSYTASTYSKDLSNIYYFMYGGEIGYDEAHTKDWTYSASITAGAQWTVYSVSATVGVQNSTTNTIGVSAVWYVPSGKYAQIKSKHERKNTVLKIYTWDGALINSLSTFPPTQTSYITAEFWN